ncbi:CbiX/SirB N-terminal domain-containing protein [Halalkalicoccus sp. NIPERK01]|uniref:CbiX/SirB N-terminal domain-containing protein n=1 Tax=Halalkalicoccus sp. NIPERK01 TaxID=3053469 RepID=UPI00256EA5BF|nr:CbiX/SirB N-terminal domain-containing protein [Halalkalicoccus sp. NIPERK01]MDL5363106.1 CbiX/SirB N-terminal domain-containing protein [Halalkalicoccus sp. NIPERK01]
MTTESILLIGRNTRNAHEVLEAHADRLSRRDVVDDVEIATYKREPIRELKAEFERISADTVYAVPMCAAHSHDTINGIPAALSYVSGDVNYCEPLGQSPAVTEVLEENGASMVPASDDVSLILVGFGSSSKPYHRQTTDYHAARLREQSAYGEVLTCYLLQNPTVECVRYNTTKNQSVAVPLFLTRTEATESRIPDELELARGGIEYADPLGEHPRITDAVHAEVEKQRALAVDDAASPSSFEEQLNRTRRPVATDGEGIRR